MCKQKINHNSYLQAKSFREIPGKKSDSVSTVFAKDLGSLANASG